MAENIPLEINLHQQSAYITIKYENDSYDLTAEYLRVHSPSAEVKGHAPGQEKLQVGKENVSIEKITPVGNYAIQVFGLPDGGDGKFSMKVSKESSGLKTIFTTEENNQTIDILGTEVEEGILYIDIYVKDYGINTAFEIYVEGNQVTGYLADMFELEGTKLD